MAKFNSKIVYTKTDEAPALATASFLPIVEAFAGTAGVSVETRDLSLAARVLAVFSDYLSDEQKVNDDLTYLGELAKKPEANIIKLPNISASVPQLKAVIKELQNQGYPIPDYKEEPVTDEDKKVQGLYNRVKGSAVNPVLREGNSDRRVPKAVKKFAQKHPHSMGEWSKDSKSHVATMGENDFASNEISHTCSNDGSVKIILEKSSGEETVLKDSISLLKGEIIDATVLRKAALIEFLDREISDAKEKGILFSLHMKATMMKVSDPIIFGHAVKTYFKDLFEKHADTFREIGVEENNGFGDVITKIQFLDAEKKAEIKADIKACIEAGPDLAMVNSDKGITNLHVPSDVIIDASMPAMIRTSGRMWNKYGELQDTKAVIPDSSYAGLYQVVFDFCKTHGAFDPRTMGTVPNVGLMAQKAEEYGSHDKTFEIAEPGTVKVIDEEGNTLMSHEVNEGDIWRMCQVKDLPIQDWVKLAVTRVKATGWPAVFWLDEERAHDKELIEKVNRYLLDHDTTGLEIKILSPVKACEYTLQRLVKGENTISVTGNVLRDYLTDLFPILEVGTSAKMLSIVPLMNGGGLFETGAGGSAPKHVQQFDKENHLRWDSLGEYLALAVSFEHLSEVNENPEAAIIGECLDDATGRLLENGKSPSRKVHELDNRDSHYFLTRYWAEELAKQEKSELLKTKFTPVAEALKLAENEILGELKDVQGIAIDIAGYYFPNEEKKTAAMRPSETFNKIIDTIS
ncbi:MAG: NADP-dependent isocitrate dehydrogenase [Crocinitomicaceae bacterium]|nr:NADP-dependent isocitrate dehydrogenase [Crocinitomicaceae bacterium]